MGKPEKEYILSTASGTPCVQSDDRNCIMELFFAFKGEAQILRRAASGEYKPLPMLEMEGMRTRLSSL